ncbi:uncharacterized protein [Penaeus vannamei]|uniref:uncharacterized protein n=1 Tax=Penaeus vannamei TaxID=6689 RepID=UPI00387F5FD7
MTTVKIARSSDKRWKTEISPQTIPTVLHVVYPAPDATVVCLPLHTDYSTTHNELHQKQVCQTALDTFRRTEKLSYRSKKLQKDIKFLNLCKYYDTEKSPTKRKKETVITDKLNKDYLNLKSILSPLDYICITRLINNNAHKKMVKVDNSHSNKLLKLVIDVKKKVDKNKVIFNFSDKNLSEEQKDILSHGLDYCLPPTKVSFHKFFLYFEKLCNNLKNCDIYNNTFNNITSNISTIANNTFKKFSRQGKQSNDAENFTSPLQTLKNDETITITKPDKGRGVVILNKQDYHQKLLSILDDHSKFKKITTKISTHLLYLEDKLKRLLRAIKPSIGESTYNFLSTSGSQPGRLYGLPKVHKPNIPLRPIISSIGTFNYNTAKFLVPIISPLTTNQYTIENSTAFANEIIYLDLEQPSTMASFDVESLFTNVPLLETTEIIVDNIQTTHLNKFGLTKDSFKKLLNIAAHHSVFSYNDDIYMQTDGVAMGSPLGPSYANAFLCHHEIN